MSGTTPDETVVRRSGRSWIVGDEQAPDLTSAMVLADLLAADLAGKTGGPGESTATRKPSPRHARPLGEAAEQSEAARLAVTVQQLEHALTARVRVEQAIGVLAERHRLRTRDAFDLLRNAARTRGRRVIDIAEEVVDSTSNSLLRLPEELERKPEPRAHIRAARRSRPVS
jgi:ANTAR domain-containing protein